MFRDEIETRAARISVPALTTVTPETVTGGEGCMSGGCARRPVGSHPPAKC